MTFSNRLSEMQLRSNPFAQMKLSQLSRWKQLVQDSTYSPTWKILAKRNRVRLSAYKPVSFKRICSRRAVPLDWVRSLKVWSFGHFIFIRHYVTCLTKWLQPVFDTRPRWMSDKEPSRAPHLQVKVTGACLRYVVDETPAWKTTVNWEGRINIKLLSWISRLINAGFIFSDATIIRD